MVLVVSFLRKLFVKAARWTVTTRRLSFRCRDEQALRRHDLPRWQDSENSELLQPGPAEKEVDLYRMLCAIEIAVL